MINKNVVDDAFNNPQSPYFSFRNVANASHYEYGAIEYNNGDFLAGPFKINNKHYGFYTIDYDPNALSIDEIIKPLLYKMDCCTFLSPSAKNKINLKYGYSTSGFINRKIDVCYSTFDFDNDAELKEFYITNKHDFQYIGECTMFFNSPKALQRIKTYLTNKEIEEWQLKIDEANSNLIAELRNTCSCKEKPYSILLYGTDDCSYSINASDINEVQYIIEQMKCEQFVRDKMTYTN